MPEYIYFIGRKIDKQWLFIEQIFTKYGDYFLTFFFRAFVLEEDAKPETDSVNTYGEIVSNILKLCAFASFEN